MLSTVYDNLLIIILLHWITYILTSFSLLTIFCYCEGTYLGGRFSTMLYINTQVRYACLIIFASLAGLPPFVGFWTKLYLALLIGKFGNWLIIVSCVILLIISVTFYISVLQRLYNTSHEINIHTESPQLSTGFILILCIFICLAPFGMHDLLICCLVFVC
uniref:NADH-ubiquinone oxidoreductase subunit 2 n=1 Tax=Nyctotherus ovalis TaxID=70075 RepID=F1AAK8_NYCOV|nr:NADH-ubiquinone oxidoreductase subunit 2 [Nyctotherus ovalis]